ncbi:hypothetical protein A2U01_0103013, partial [Trifolium medium]|nr:hypothetical protein [Trifolium medium]
TRRNDKGEVEVLVKWKDLPAFENSWELVDKLSTACAEAEVEEREIGF